MLLRALVVCEGAAGDRLVELLRGEDVDAVRARSLAEAERIIEQQPVDLVLLDARGREEAAADGLAVLRERDPDGEIIVLAREPVARRHAEWVAGGAFGVVYDEAAPHRLEAALRTLIERRRVEITRATNAIPDEDYGLADYVTSSPVMRALLAEARRVVQVDTTVLILGETGVGKGLLARSLHNDGPRARHPFVAVNCGAIPETLLDSELFGHARGAFTGADRARRGHFELAHRGTIFLDEIGELSPTLQVKLLHVLEDRRIRPLGTERDLDVDVRVIAATNRPLEEDIAAGRFRSDLYYRLNVVSLTLPPLRERREDIAEIAFSYVDHFRVKLRRNVFGLSPEAVEALLRYPWPGNIRELGNAIERAVIMTEGSSIDLESLPLWIQEHAPPAIDVAHVSHDPDPSWTGRTWSDVRRETVERAEVAYLTGLLREKEGRIAEVARAAGMDPRSVYEKMRKYGLRKEAFRRSAAAGTC